MRQVEVPGVGYVNYPDDWSDEQIREHATQHSQKWLAAEPAPQQPAQPDKSNPTGFLPNLSAGFRSAAGPGICQHTLLLLRPQQMLPDCLSCEILRFSILLSKLKIL